MSLAFSDTTNQDGIIQRIETTVYGGDGLTRISGNSTQLAIWTGRINVALDRAFALIFEADGRWQFDDSNHTDYPTIITNLVANQRDYSFTSDANSNLILEVKAVYAQSEDSTVFERLTPVQEIDEWDFYDGQNRTGTPTAYGKKANAVVLGPVPSYSKNSALKIEISREGSYFATSDTTKKPGFAGLFHDYLVVRPAFEYAIENNLSNAQGLQVRVLELEEEIKKYYARRDEDERKIMSMKRINHI